MVAAINSCTNLEYLNLEGNTLGVDASKAIAKALETKGELKRALWKDMFTGRMKEEIPKALVRFCSCVSGELLEITNLNKYVSFSGILGEWSDSC